MRCSIIFIILVFFSTHVFTQSVINIPAGELCIEIISWKKNVFVVTNKSIYALKNRKLDALYVSNNPVIGAIATENTFFVLTKKDVSLFKTETLKKIQSIALNETIAKSLIGLRADSAQKRVYLLTHDEGIYHVNDSTLALFLLPNNINDAVFISDTDYWLGTQSGLGHQTGKRYLRYVEESITGFSIPDNLVEHLHRTPDNRLVVQMAEALSVFELAGDKTEGHGSDLEFIGQKGNEIYSICGLPKGFTLFATQNGLILAGKNALENEPEGGIKEVYSPTNKKAYRIKPSELGFGNDKSIRFLRAVFDGKKSVYLSTNNTIVIVPLKKVIN